MQNQETQNRVYDHDYIYEEEIARYELEREIGEDEKEETFNQ